MNTKLVTIIGPEGLADVAAPADTPIAELMPTLADLAGGSMATETTWELAGPGMSSLDPARSLAAAGIVDGAVLHLRPHREARPAALDHRPWHLDADTPLARTAAVLPERTWPGARMAAAARAAWHRADPPSPPSFGVADPRALTRTGPRTPMARARNHWRSTAYQHRLTEAIRAPRLRRCVTIAVVSPKGGVGKTTLTALLGGLFALERHDRCVAVDTNPVYGTLGRTLAPNHDLFVDDVLDLLEQPALTAAELDASLGRASHGLMVLPAPTEPSRMARLDGDAYATIIAQLQNLTGLLLLDCGTGLQEPASQAAIAAADQLVLVTDAEPSTASLVAEVAGALDRAGPPLVLVVNKYRGPGTRLDMDALAAQVPRARGLLTVEHDRTRAARLASGEFSWTADAGRWATSVRQLAAVLTSEWPRARLAPV